MDEDDLAIDRYAIGEALPGEVELTTRWVLDNHDAVLGWSSEESEDEKERLRPGLELMAQLARFDLEEAQADAGSLKESLSLTPKQLYEQRPKWWGTRLEAEQAQQQWLREARATLRGHLRDVLHAAESIGIPRQDVPTLLQQVLSAPTSDTQDSPDTVVPLHTRRNRHRQQRRSD